MSYICPADFIIVGSIQPLASPVLPPLPWMHDVTHVLNVFIGDHAVGKTCIIHRRYQGTFSTTFPMTINPAYTRMTVMTDKGLMGVWSTNTMTHTQWHINHVVCTEWMCSLFVSPEVEISAFHTCQPKNQLNVGHLKDICRAKFKNTRSRRLIWRISSTPPNYCSHTHPSL